MTCVDVYQQYIHVHMWPFNWCTFIIYTYSARIEFDPKTACLFVYSTWLDCGIGEVANQTVCNMYSPVSSSLINYSLQTLILFWVYIEWVNCFVLIANESVLTELCVLAAIFFIVTRLGQGYWSIGALVSTHLKEPRLVGSDGIHRKLNRSF